MLLLFGQCAAYSVGAIFGFSLLVPISLYLISFRGNCLLFSRGTYQDNGNFTPDWSSPFYCYLVIVTALLMVIVSLIGLVKSILLICTNRAGSSKTALVEIVTALVMVVLVLINAIMVSTGFALWCNAVEQRFSRGCDQAADQITIEGIPAPEGFFIDMEAAQFSLWSSLVIWSAILTICGRIFFLHHERESLISSMARERSRYQRIYDDASPTSDNCSTASQEPSLHH